MGNAPSAHDGRDGRLAKGGKLKSQPQSQLQLQSQSPELSWPFSATPMAGTMSPGLPPEHDAQFNHQVPIASLLHQRHESTSHINLRDEDLKEVADTLGNLQHTESKESFSTYLTPRASSSKLTAPSEKSLAFDPKQVDLRTAVAILEELRKTASPDDLVALRMWEISKPLFKSP
jgi:hypothetical protein